MVKIRNYFSALLPDTFSNRGRKSEEWNATCKKNKNKKQKHKNKKKNKKTKQKQKQKIKKRKKKN